MDTEGSRTAVNSSDGTFAPQFLLLLGWEGNL
jgi:hypothetical protein